jgi:hypothetical protein
MPHQDPSNTSLITHTRTVARWPLLRSNTRAQQPPPTAREIGLKVALLSEDKDEYVFCHYRNQRQNMLMVQVLAIDSLAHRVDRHAQSRRVLHRLAMDTRRVPRHVSRPARAARAANRYCGLAWD